MVDRHGMLVEHLLGQVRELGRNAVTVVNLAVFIHPLVYAVLLGRERGGRRKHD